MEIRAEPSCFSTILECKPTSHQWIDSLGAVQNCVMLMYININVTDKADSGKVTVGHQSHT